jgi:hypothetical protein
MSENRTVFLTLTAEPDGNCVLVASIATIFAEFGCRKINFSTDKPDYFPEILRGRKTKNHDSTVRKSNRFSDSFDRQKKMMLANISVRKSDSFSDIQQILKK